MTEEDLKKAILEKIQKEKEAIVTQARKEAESILNQANAEVSSLKEKYVAQMQKRCLLERTRELNQINLQIKRSLLEEKEKKILEVFSSVEERLEAISEDKNGYRAVFKRLLEESLENFPVDTKLKLKVNPQDNELALEVLREFPANIQLETKESIDTGLELCDLKENKIILNTFTSRWEKLQLPLRSEISKILFF